MKIRGFDTDISNAEDIVSVIKYQIYNIKKPLLKKKKKKQPSGPSRHPASYRPTSLHLPSATWHLVCNSKLLLNTV